MGKIPAALERKAELKGIVQEILRKGASEAKLIPVRHIVVDERVRLKCQIPLCDSYNRNLMCPPHLPSVVEFRAALLRFSHAVLVQVTVQLKKKPVRKRNDVYLPAKKLHDLINQAEKMAFASGFPFATGLIGGCCRLCDECVAASGGLSCRHPFKARPSMEAMGIDVTATLDKVGMSCSFPITDTVRWTGLILV